jgi:N-acetylmuramic acid 6-phosphate etherase
VVTDADIGIVLDTGPEIISGSTRLKAGTAQKIVLNTLSSALMVRLHKVYGNLMVDLHPSNAKLVERAVQLTMHATGSDTATARGMLEQCHFQVKIAIVALLKKLTVEQAQTLLDEADGDVRAALR